jgi:hypothetical protein
MPIPVLFLVVLACAGVAVYLFNSLVKMDERFKLAINAFIGLFLFLFCLWCLSAFFGWGWFNGTSAAPLTPHGR